MRYDPRKRIDFPHFEDASLWRALDTIGVTYEKIPRVAPHDASTRENWYATARVWLDEGKFGLIDFEEARLLNQTDYATINKRSIRARDRRWEWWRKQNIPLFLASRKWHAHETEFYIKKWLSEIKGNSDTKGSNE